MSNEIANQKKLTEVVDEYESKLSELDNVLSEYEQVCKGIASSTTVCGQFGKTIQTSRIYKHEMEKSLLRSAWSHVYEGLNIKSISSATDRKKFEQALDGELAPFTLDNIKATFGDYLLNPRANILRGLAEVFCNLDPYYKSHNKVKIGNKGMPKRVIISGLDSFYGWGAEKITDIINALASYERKPLVSKWNEVREIEKDGEALKDSYGVRLVTYKNGNGHLFFEPQQLININKALAEFYGDVLPDVQEEVTTKKQSTEVSKDLQYYPTPKKVIQEILWNTSGLKGAKVLEPSCGCGRIMQELRQAGATVFGIEYDTGRVNEARAKGFDVLHANFLETVPTGDYDFVIMNPPFYGKHYVKHVEHALKFLKPDGVLKSILPATARYDHKILKGQWSDLPVGSFSESGTNINTTVLTIRNN